MSDGKKPVGKAGCCWVCGHPGGIGANSVLRFAGYRVAVGEVALAHPRCLVRLRDLRVVK